MIDLSRWLGEEYGVPWAADSESDELEVEALLEIVGSSPRVALAPELIERDDAKAELSLVFPSLAALDLYSPQDAGGLRLRLIWGAEEQELDVIYRRN